MGSKRLLLVVALTWLLATGCDGPDPTVASLPDVDLIGEPVPDAPDPTDRAGASADFVVCEYGIGQGGWSNDFGPPGSAADPEGALDQFLDSGYFALPRRGFVAAGKDQDRVLFTYSVAGESRAAVIIADGANVALGERDGWLVETFAACDPAEYDPSADGQLPFDIWLDASGARVPTSTINSSRGSEHCDWESVTFLWLDEVQYVRDPRGVLVDRGQTIRFDDDAELPPDAIDTGYHREEGHLWVSIDGSIAYLVGDRRTEVWQIANPLIACE